MDNKDQQAFGQTNTNNDSVVDGKTTQDIFQDTKFKDSESLFKAYNMLQADYTKKCQALSELQKQMGDKPSVKSELEAVSSWQQKVEEFFLRTPQAREYSEALASIIKSNNDISNSTDPLESAWTVFAKTNFVDKKALAVDEKFLSDYIYSNEQIKTKIISDYFASLDRTQSPNLMSKTFGTSMILTPKQKPKTIRDATTLVQDIFDV